MIGRCLTFLAIAAVVMPAKSVGDSRRAVSLDSAHETRTLTVMRPEDDFDTLPPALQQLRIDAVARLAAAGREIAHERARNRIKQW